MNNKYEAWNGWIEEFRLLWPKPPKKDYAVCLLAELFGFSRPRRIETISDNRAGNGKAVMDILASLPTLSERIEKLNQRPNWGLTEASLTELRRNLLPRLAKVCKDLLGQTKPPSYQLLDRHFDDLRIWESKWKTVSNVTLININGGRFRNRRIESQSLKRPATFVKPTEVGLENKRQMSRRIALELEGEEPWGPQLQRLTVFIASKEMYERWLRSDGIGEFESPIATRMFWSKYLRKLLRVAAEQRRAGKRKRSPLVVELYEVGFMDFVAHGFDCDIPGGHIVGSHLLCGASAPLGFEVQWPLGSHIPEHFRVFKKALEDIKTLAMPLPLNDYS